MVHVIRKNGLLRYTSIALQRQPTLPTSSTVHPILRALTSNPNSFHTTNTNPAPLVPRHPTPHFTQPPKTTHPHSHFSSGFTLREVSVILILWTLAAGAPVLSSSLS
jgi:hypothetical protein